MASPIARALIPCEVLRIRAVCSNRRGVIERISYDARDGSGLEELSRLSGDGNGNVLVEGVGEEARYDDGVDEGVGGVDVDITTRERGERPEDGGEDSGVALADELSNGNCRVQ